MILSQRPEIQERPEYRAGVSSKPLFQTSLPAISSVRRTELLISIFFGKNKAWVRMEELTCGRVQRPTRQAHPQFGIIPIFALQNP
jgi:hypothetical protein